MIQDIIRTDRELKIYFNRTFTVVGSIFALLTTTIFISYFIFSLVNSTKFHDKLFLALTIIFLLLCVYSFITYNIIYRGLKDSNDKIIVKENGIISINGRQRKISEIKNLFKYKVTSRYGTKNFYFAIEFSTGKKEYLAIRLSEIEANNLKSELEKFFGAKIISKDKFFGH